MASQLKERSRQAKDMGKISGKSAANMKNCQPTFLEAR